MTMIRLSPPPELDISLGEALFTQRAIRRLDHSQVISDDDLKLVLDAASKAPSGGNAQQTRFLVVRDRDKLRAFGKLYHEAWWAKRAEDSGWVVDQPLPEDSPMRMNALLAREMVDAPVVVLGFVLDNSDIDVIPAAQNLMLAARGLGIGSVLTTLHACIMERVHELFGIPDEVRFRCCIPLGYPRGNFGLTQRYPSAETTYWDEWHARPPWD